MTRRETAAGAAPHMFRALQSEAFGCAPLHRGSRGPLQIQGSTLNPGVHSQIHGVHSKGPPRGPTPRSRVHSASRGVHSGSKGPPHPGGLSRGSTMHPESPWSRRPSPNLTACKTRTHLLSWSPPHRQDPGGLPHQGSGRPPLDSGSN